MAEPLTYGRLVESACREAATAVAQQPPTAADDAVNDVAALVSLLALTGRHARFLGHAAGTRNPASTLAARIIEVTQTARPLLSAETTPSTGRWHAASDLLGTAHDLLAAQLGPAGEWRGPDAAALRDRPMITAAAGRLARLVVLIADSAGPHAEHLRHNLLDAVAPPTPPSESDRSGGNRAGVRDVLAAAQALDQIRQIREHAVRFERSYSRVSATALDEVTPLLGDRAGDPAQQPFEQMRYAVHKLTWPQVHVHGATLRAVTELAITISAWTSEVAELAHRHSRHATQPHYARAAQHAKTSALAWHNVAHHLGALHTLGFDGRHAHEHAARLRRQIDTGPRAATTPADRLAALPTVRHAVLLLPELAGASNIAIRHLAADGLLRAATVTGTWVKLPNRVDALTNAYRDAATAARWSDPDLVDSRREVH